jgi:hypothetical protein
MSGMKRAIWRRTGMVIATLVMASGLTSCLVDYPARGRSGRYRRDRYQQRRGEHRRDRDSWCLQPDSFTVTHEVPNTR